MIGNIFLGKMHLQVMLARREWGREVMTYDYVRRKMLEYRFIIYQYKTYIPLAAKKSKS